MTQPSRRRDQAPPGGPGEPGVLGPRLAPFLHGTVEALGLACTSEAWYHQVVEAPGFWRNCTLPELDFRLAAHQRAFALLGETWRRAHVTCEHVWLLADTHADPPPLADLQGLVVRHLSLVDQDSHDDCAVTAATLQALPKFCPQLQRLDLPRLAADVTDDDVWLACVTSLPHLDSLDFAGFTDKCLLQLVQIPRRWQRLGFQHSSITGHGLRDRLPRVTGLTELDLASCDDLGDDDAPWLGGAGGPDHWGQQLRVLNLSRLAGWQVNAAWIRRIALLPRLQELNICDSRGIDAIPAMSNLCLQENRFRQLRKLDLGGTTPVRTSGLSFLSQLSELEELHLPRGSSDLTGACLLFVRGLVKLRILRADLRVTDQQLESLSALTELRTLELSSMQTTAITDTGLAALASLTNLEELRVPEAGRLHGEGLAYLWPLARLRKLVLSGCGLTDQGLAALPPLGSLRHLDLSNCSGLATDLQVLSGLAGLQELHLRCCAYLTDAGLSSLGRPRNLRVLGLRGCRLLTGTGLAHLRSLAELDLEGCTGLTDEGLSRLACDG
eukprot:g55764.t1